MTLTGGGKASASCRECMKKGLGGNKTFRIASKSLINSSIIRLPQNSKMYHISPPHGATPGPCSSSGKNNGTYKAFPPHLAPWNRGFWRVSQAAAVTVYRCAWLSVIECKWHPLCCPHPGKTKRREESAFIRPPTLGFRTESFQVYWVPKQPLKRAVHLSDCPFTSTHGFLWLCFSGLWFHLWSIDYVFQ